jgi:hypothetical protein
MKLTAIDEQHLRTYAKQSPADLALVITADAEQAHAADNLIAEVLTVHLFLEFAKQLAPLLEEATTIGKLILATKELFGWLHKTLSGKANPKPAPLPERALVVLFDAYANRRAGVTSERLQFLLGTDSATIEKTLADLVAHGVARHGRDGAWRFKAGHR